MSLNTAEKFLILAHRPEKGGFIPSNLYIKYGLIGALFLDMSLENIVSAQDNRLIYRSAGMNKDQVVSEISAVIRQSEKTRKIRYWITKFARKSRRYFWVRLNQLSDKKLMRIENKKFLGLIPYRRSYLIGNSIRADLIRTARNNVLFHKELTDENIVVLGLIEACRMHKVLSSDREELKKIRKDLKEIIKASPIAGVLSETIKQVQAAVVAAVIASSTASTGGH
jgi:hypothetical protein